VSTTHVALLGGVERRGRWSPGGRVVHVAVIGGADLDFTEAELPAEVTLTAVSVIGGVHLKIPPGVRVEASGLSIGLIGSESFGPDRAQATAIIRVRRFGLLGGVRVDQR
jgi:hypothetical protein